MTTIVGGVMPHGIVMVADTRTSDNEINQYWESRVLPKINKRNGVIWGVAGDANVCDLLTYIWEPPQLKFNDPLLLIHTVLMPSLTEIIPDGENTWNMLIGFKGTLFNIMDKSVVHDERTWYSAVGSGAPYALGSLHGQKRTVSALINAVDTAAFYDPATGGRTQTFTLGRDEQ